MKTVSKTINSQLLTYHVLEQKIRFLSKEKESIKKNLLSIMKDSNILEAIDYTATFSVNTRYLLDNKAIKEALGENLAVYQKKTTVKNFSVIPKTN